MRREDEYRVGKEKDGVDAAELLEKHEAHAHNHGALRRALEQVAKFDGRLFNKRYPEEMLK